MADASITTRYCVLNGPNTANGRGETAIPSQLFDNVYYVGKTDIGAWVLKTSDGLVLFDTLNNADEAANIIVPGMRKLGLPEMPGEGIVGGALKPRAFIRRFEVSRRLERLAFHSILV